MNVIFNSFDCSREKLAKLCSGRIWLGNPDPRTGALFYIYFSRNILTPAADWYVNSQFTTLQWRHNEHDGVSDRRHLHCLLKCWFRHRKHQSSASLAFVRGIHRSPVNSPHKRPVTRKMFPIDDVIMNSINHAWAHDVYLSLLSSGWLIPLITCWRPSS